MIEKRTPATRARVAGADKITDDRPYTLNPATSQILRGWRVDASLSVELLWRPTLREVYQ